MNNLQIPPPAAVAAPAVASSFPQQQQQQQQPIAQQHRVCIRCHHPNPDLILPSCHCTLHARCTPVPIRACPNPHHAHLPLHPGCPLTLLPMDFTDLDEARKSCSKRGKPAKKKAKLDTDDDDYDTALSSDLRTGRWTQEETCHCDNLIHHFMGGRLPLSDGLKLNEFLANMLKSKQSRLTKKMKNAKLSTKTFKRTSGYLADDLEARQFSDIESAYFSSIPNLLERSEMKFHMAKEWREAFSTYCVSHGQSLNVDAWLASVEEMDRRNQRVKEMERSRRREIMMGCALRQDGLNPDRGVVIDGVKSGGDGVGGVNSNSGSGAVEMNGGNGMGSSATGEQQDYSNQADSTNITSYNNSIHSTESNHSTAASSSETTTTSPFLQKITSFLTRHHIPFEYIDVWVPSFVPDDKEDAPKCRLCFAGSSIVKQVILDTNSNRRAVPLSPEEQFNLSSFGDYSESFSFDVGCGLPGRVYHMGVPTWEQSVHNAPLNHFERVGGAQQWGIRTVVGIPVPSPNVGRVVVVLYSRYDRAKDHDLVIRLAEEFTRLMPSPKWKLVVDVGEAPPVVQQQQTNSANGASSQTIATAPNGDSAILTSEVISMFGEHMPSDPSNPGFAFLQGFMSLRLLLLRTSRSPQEQDVVNTILSSYLSYKAGGRTRPDMALMLARDFMFLNQQQGGQVQQSQQQQVHHQQQVQGQQQMQQVHSQQQHHQQAQSQQQMQSQQQQVHMNGQGQSVQSYLPVANNSNQVYSSNQSIPSHSTVNSAPAPVTASNQSHTQPENHSYTPAPSAQYQPQDSSQYHQPQDSTQYQPQDSSQQYQQDSENYFMMGDIDPAPVNNPKPCSALDEAIDNVERLLSPDNTGSANAF